MRSQTLQGGFCMMMSKWVKVIGIGLFAMSTAFAQVNPKDARTKEQLIKFVKDAVAMTKANKDEAFKKMNAPEIGKPAAYTDGELYIYAYDSNMKVVAHGANPQLIGADLSQKKDPKTGKMTIQELKAEAYAPKNGGIVEFYWPHPKDMTKVLKKLGYVEKVNDNLWLGSGIYLSEEKK